MDDGVNPLIVSLLAYWYSNQSAEVRRQSAVSVKFGIGNGVRQGAVLSPYMFTTYIRDMVRCVVDTGIIGCSIGGHIINLLAYADDIVLFAPSWRAMQSLLSGCSQCAVWLFRPFL